MSQVTHIRTPVDATLLRVHLDRLCARPVLLRAMGQENAATGPRNIIRITFDDPRDHARLTDALRAAHMDMRAPRETHTKE